MEAGPSLPTMMVSTTPWAIQPSSERTTGTASAIMARSSLPHSALATTSRAIFLLYMAGRSERVKREFFAPFAALGLEETRLDELDQRFCLYCGRGSVCRVWR